MQARVNALQAHLDELMHVPLHEIGVTNHTLAEQLCSQGVGSDPVDQSWNCGNMCMALAQYSANTFKHQVDVDLGSTVCIQHIVKLTKKAVDQVNKNLEEVRTRDSRDKEAASIRSMWMHKGPTKIGARKMKAYNTQNQFVCEMDQAEFLQAVVDKGCIGAIEQLHEHFPVPPLPQLTSDSMISFGRRWTAREFRNIILRIKNGKAYSRLSKLPKELIKGIVEVANKQLVTHVQNESIEEVITAYANFAASTGVVPLDWIIVQLAPIFKENKIDPNVVHSAQEVKEINCTLKYWREVALADAIRTIIGAGLCERYMAFACTNLLHENASLAYLPGFDSIRIHHARSNLMQAYMFCERPVQSIQKPMALLQLMADLDSFFSRITDDVRLLIMQDNCFPSTIIQLVQALHHGKAFVSTDKDEVYGPAKASGEIMGSGEAMVIAQAATNVLFRALKHHNIGFVWPSSPDLPAPASQSCCGGSQCDDIMVFTGGENISVDCAVEQFETAGRIVKDWAVRYKLPFAVDPIDVTNSKSYIPAVARDEYGFINQLDNILQFSSLPLKGCLLYLQLASQM